MIKNLFNQLLGSRPKKLANKLNIWMEDLNGLDNIEALRTSTLKIGKVIDESLKERAILKQASDSTSNNSSLDTWVITDQSSTGLGARVNRDANITATRDRMASFVIDGEPNNVQIGLIKGE